MTDSGRLMPKDTLNTPAPVFLMGAPVIRRCRAGRFRASLTDE